MQLFKFTHTNYSSVFQCLIYASFDILAKQEITFLRKQQNEKKTQPTTKKKLKIFIHL